MARWVTVNAGLAGGVILCHSVVTCLAEILCYRRHFTGRALNFTHFWVRRWKGKDIPWLVRIGGIPVGSLTES